MSLWVYFTRSVLKNSIWIFPSLHSTFLFSFKLLVMSPFEQVQQDCFPSLVFAFTLSLFVHVSFTSFFFYAYFLEFSFFAFMNTRSLVYMLVVFFTFSWISLSSDHDTVLCFTLRVRWYGCTNKKAKRTVTHSCILLRKTQENLKKLLAYILILVKIDSRGLWNPNFKFQ